MAKQAIRMTGFEFPNARSGYYPPGSIVPNRISDDDFSSYQYDQNTQSQPASSAPSASSLLQKSG